jgi:hypothetical protein
VGSERAQERKKKRERQTVRWMTPGRTIGTEKHSTNLTEEKKKNVTAKNQTNKRKQNTHSQLGKKKKQQEEHAETGVGKASKITDTDERRELKVEDEG